MSFFENFIPDISHKTETWILEQQLKHLPDARPLTDVEISGLSYYYDPELLRTVRLKSVHNMDSPPFYQGLKIQLKFLKIRLDFDFKMVEAITFGNCIVIREGLLTNDTLFHELVHVEQYAQLGTQRFANAYIRGLVNGGFKYENIPLEQIAFALTERRTRGDSFSVRDELQTWLASRKY